MAFSRHANSAQVHLPEFTSSKVPPYWDESLSRNTPFRIWVADLRLWAAATELPEARIGPSVALRLGGTARALVREIPTDSLVQGEQHPTVPPTYDAMGQEIFQLRRGIDIIINILTRKFAPLEQENRIRVLNDFFRFRKQYGEDIDAIITRYELIRYRAHNEAGLIISPIGAAWLLMMHIGIATERWPLLLAPLQGQLPTDDHEYAQFVEYMRRNCHIWESQGFGEKSINPRHTSQLYGGVTENDDYGDHFSIFPTTNVNHDHHDDEVWYDAMDAGGWEEPMPTFATDVSGMLDLVTDSSVEDDEDRHYFAMADEELYGGDEDGNADLTAFLSQEAPLVAALLRRNFKKARARFTRFTGFKPKRFVRRRFGSKGKRKGKGFGFRTFLADQAAYKGFHKKGKAKGKGASSGVDLSSFAVGSFFGKNPIDKTTGAPMECFGCGATDHLAANCPKGGGKGKKGGGKGGKSYLSTQSASSAAAPSYDPYSWYYIGDEVQDGGGVQIEELEEEPDNHRGVSTWSRSAHSYQSQVAPYIGASYGSTPFSSGFQNPAVPFTPSNGGIGLVDAPDFPTIQVGANLPSITVTSASLPATAQTKPTPFWPTWVNLRTERHAPTEGHEFALMFHAKTRLGHGREGLLVDPGALLNLAGQEWIERQAVLAQGAGLTVIWTDLKQAMSVEGVGKGAQPCGGAARVPIKLQNGEETLFETPWIAGSAIPALLGLETLRKKQAVMDCYNGILYLVAGNGSYKMSLPKGSTTLKLERAPSGHWLLPCSEWH